MPNAPRMRLYAPASGRAFGELVAASLGVPLAPVEEREFADGEHKSRPLDSVRACDAYVVQSLYGEPEQGVNDKLCRLLFLIGALGDSGASTVTAVVPYLAYARKDRKTKPRDPVTTRYVAALFEAVGTHRIVTLDVHNPVAFQNAFRCRTEHLEARHLYAEHFAALVGGDEAVVVSPDAGGVKRAERFRAALSATLGRELPMAFIEKYRSAGVVSGGAVVGELRGRTALILDDMIGTGTTLARAARACRDAGATRALAAATHGLFVTGAEEALADEALEQVVVTNAVPPFRLGPGPAREKLVVLDAAPLVAEAIRRLASGGSLVELCEGAA